MSSRTHAGSPYMQFAKLRSGARYNLAASGIASCPISELPVRVEDLEINGPDLYGYAPLKERLAKLTGVPPECVVTAAGTSMANHLAMAATLEPGEEALVEWPTYELLVTTLQYLGATVRHFRRRREDGFRLDPAEVERQITPHTRLVVLTNLHNPSGAWTDEATLRTIGDIAGRHSARVLVDEVYLEALYEQRPRPAIHLGDHFLVTSSLTKAFGLSGLRCGWVLANPELTRRMWHINDLYGVNGAHPAELLSVIALDNLDRIAARAKKLLEANRPLLDALLQSRRDLACVRPEFGTIAFPQLLSGTVDALDRLLREKYETSIVPGRHFGMPQHFRIGIGGEPEMTRAGLKRLGSALDELNSG
ncbi:MAG TPA: aminotransferase class I/II-fold pyridoxal phosphate-dependent enzyme [Candidatus Binatia bacterium]|nr:aminotransferase class I/II-fold pyridoxal phosphate-dependent enzyme [Candidatus Binatia bacterium]